MKKHILSFVLITAMIGSIAASCGSSKNATSSDSTKMSTPAPAAADTAKKDTTKKDTTKHM
ncbi:MAG TPA: hypothetical protein VGN20_05300 [Mucilaginibacter sp.]|jgi:hypothetical protein